MTVRELINALKQLPPSSEITADIMGEEELAEIVCVGECYNKMDCYITIDRTRSLQCMIRDIEMERDEYDSYD